MFTVFRNAWKIPEMRKKLFYMLFILLIVRLGTHIPVPGLSLNDIANPTTDNSLSTLFTMMTGGSYGTVFAMGIGPYINASIIMQLLTVAIPKLEQINKDGEDGRKKINQYTRIFAVVLSFLQGAGQIYSIHTEMAPFQTGIYSWIMYAVALLTMVTGTIFIMWLGEKLTEKGVGNGSSFIIFANILAGLPAGVQTLWVMATGEENTAWISVLLILLIFVFVVGFVILVQDGERRIPVQYSKKMVGRKMFGGQTSFIPIKVNIAGVMSIIFAISLLQFPQTIQQLFGIEWLKGISETLSISNPIGAVVYVILIFCFTFFYTSFAFNPIEVAENMKKNGGFIPGIRPGKPTSEYIQDIVDRISLIGACFYAVIAMIPVIMGWIFKINIGIGGTTLLIVTGVALEIVKQIESQLLMRHYKGFLN